MSEIGSGPGYTLRYGHTEDGVQSAVILNATTANLRVDDVLRALAKNHGHMTLVINGDFPVEVCDDRLLSKFSAVQIESPNSVFASKACDALYDYECNVMARGETSFAPLESNIWRSLIGSFHGHYNYDNPGNLYCIAWVNSQFCEQCSVTELRLNWTAYTPDEAELTDSDLFEKLQESGLYDPAKHHVVKTGKFTLYTISEVEEDVQLQKCGVVS